MHKYKLQFQTIKSFSYLPNLNLVRLFISYHLHIYRLVSVVHRINAAFGVSQKFTPYRVPITGKYAVFKKSISCSTTLTSTGIKFVSDKTAYYRVSVTAHYGGSKPLGVTVKQKVNSSATPHAFLVAENDLVSAISVSGMMQLGVGGEFEVFAKYEAAASNDFYMLIEELG